MKTLTNQGDKMQKELTYEQKESIAHYIETVNELIMTAKAQKAKVLVKDSAKFIKTFTLLNKSDLESIFEKTVLEKRPYAGIHESTYVETENLQESFESIFLPFTLLDVISDIETLKEQLSTDELYYMELDKLHDKCTKLYKFIHSNTDIYEFIRSVPIHLLKIDTAIARNDTGIKNISKIKKLADKFVKKYSIIKHEAKKYDNFISEIKLLDVS